MKTDNKFFLSHFIEEEIYIINDKKNQINDIKSPKDANNKPKSSQILDDQSPKVKLTFTGNNSSGVLIIVNKINENEKQFLSKVLSAVSLRLEDCALLITAENNSQEHVLQIKSFKAKNILNFGTSLYDTQLYQIHPLEATRILNADSLEEISADKEKKKLLWTSLQFLFPDSAIS